MKDKMSREERAERRVEVAEYILNEGHSVGEAKSKYQVSNPYVHRCLKDYCDANPSAVRAVVKRSNASKSGPSKTYRCSRALVRTAVTIEIPALFSHACHERGALPWIDWTQRWIDFTAAAEKEGIKIVSRTDFEPELCGPTETVEGELPEATLE